MSINAPNLIAGSADPKNTNGPHKVNPVLVNEDGALDLCPTRMIAVTPHDTNPITPPFRAVYVGGAGNIAANDGVAGSSDILFTAVPQGTVLVGRFAFIRSTLTTATLMVGFR